MQKRYAREVSAANVSALLAQGPHGTREMRSRADGYVAGVRALGARLFRSDAGRAWAERVGERHARWLVGTGRYGDHTAALARRADGGTA